MTFHNIFEQKGKKEKKLPKIIIDIHEKNSLVPSILIKENIQLKFKHLSQGDYQINNFCIERKTINDFYSSLISLRLDSQLLKLSKKKYPLLIIEGNLKIHPKSSIIQSKIVSLILNNNLKILFSTDEKDTALILKRICNLNSLKNKFILKNLKQQDSRISILASFPKIGPQSAQKLLSKFKTLRTIFNTKIPELEKIIGTRSNSFKILDQ